MHVPKLILQKKGGAIDFTDAAGYLLSQFKNDDSQ
jgi:hypothetical protein